MPCAFHLVGLLYGLSFLVTAAGPSAGVARPWGWLLLAIGYTAMAAVPERVWTRPFGRKFRDGRWVMGHCLLMAGVGLLFGDLVTRRFFA